MPAATPPPITPARRRWRRWRWAILALMAAAGAVLLVTRSPLTGAILLPIISSKFGAEVTAESVRISPRGVVTMNRVTVNAPFVPGPAGAFASAERIRLDLDAWSILSTPKVEEVELIAPVFRVSQSLTDETVNISGIKAPESSGKLAAGDFPRIIVRRGSLELGEHDAVTYTRLRRIALDGEIMPSADPEGGYRISLRQAEGTGEDLGERIALEGWIRESGLAVTLQGVDMKNWPPSTVPTPIREFWANLALEGRLSEVSFVYAFQGSPTARIRLDKVAMNLPLPAEGAPDSGEAVGMTAGGRPSLKLSNTDGTIRISSTRISGELDGLLEDLPYKIAITWDGLAALAPFSAELTTAGFRLEKEPKVLRFAPEIVRERLAQFSNPTAIVDSRVRITRAEPYTSGDGTLKPGEIKVAGDMNFRDAVASFEGFPYTFEQMQGRIIFTDGRIELHEITGVAANGATIRASGVIAPLTSDAGVDLDFELKKVPILDGRLEAGFGPERVKIFETIISRKRLAELRERGLIRDPAREAALRDELSQALASGDRAAADRAKRFLDAPQFSPGGEMSLAIQIRRFFGERSAWAESIVADLPLVGLLPDKFPLPLIGRDAQVRVDDSRIEVLGSPFTTLRGGTVELSTRIRLDPSAPIGGQLGEPEVSILASDLPVDDLLINALAVSGGGGGQADPARTLTDLGATGSLSGNVDVSISPTGDVLVAGAIVPRGLSLRPAPGGRPSTHTLTDLAGQVRFAPGELSTQITGTLRRADEQGPATLASVNAGLSAARENNPGQVTATVDLQNLDPSAPIEDFAGVFSPAVARVVDDLRKRYNPAGKLDAAVSVKASTAPDAKPDASVLVTSIRELEFDAFGTRLAIGPASGRALVEASSDGVRVSLDRVAGPIFADKVACGEVAMHGTLPAGDQVAGRPGRIDVSLRGARIESPLTRAVLRRSSPKLATMAAEADARGGYGADLTLTAKPRPDENPYDVVARLRPESLSFISDSTEVSLMGAGGAIEVSTTHGRIERAVFVAPTWTLTADGSWSVLDAAAQAGSPADAGISATLSLDLESTAEWKTGIPADLRAALPRPVSDLLAMLTADARSLSTRGLKLSLIQPEGAERVTSIASSGTLGFTGASLDAGVKVTDAGGRVAYTLDRPGADAPLSYDAQIALDRFRAANVEMSQGRVRVQSGFAPGQVLVPLLAAECHAGRAAGEAFLTPDPADPQRSLYQSDVRLSGVRLSPLLADLRPTKDAAAPDQNRGSIDANLTLSGRIGDLSSRRGRGRATIGDGRVISLPMLTALIRASNLQPPTDEQLDNAVAVFTLDAGTISFEQLTVSSSSIEIAGFGTMTWPETQLDLKLTSRAGRRIPLLSDMLEGLRDELISTAVTGTLAEPKLEMNTLSTTRWVVRRILGVEETDQERRMDQIERDARRERDRIQRRAPKGQPPSIEPARQSPQGQ